MSESNTGLRLTRRMAIAGALTLPAFTALPTFAARAATIPAETRLDALERRTGASIGVAAIDMGGGNAVFYRETTRFLMSSSFKLLLVAAVLARADSGAENLSRLVHYTKADLLDYSPATTANLAAGMPVAALCEAAITLSDNAAANLLLASIGGPTGYTAFLRGLGDTTTRLDRPETALNIADDDKDTTTPSAMLADMRMVLLGDVLKPASRQRLLDWLGASSTGKARLRAGLPSGWAVGDKTGTGSSAVGSATLADLAIATPPPSSDGKARKPVLIVTYVMGGQGSDADREAIFAETGRILADALT